MGESAYAAPACGGTACQMPALRGGGQVADAEFVGAGRQVRGICVHPVAPGAFRFPAAVPAGHQADADRVGPPGPALGVPVT